MLRLVLCTSFILSAVAIAGDSAGQVLYFKPSQVDAARASGDTGSALITNSEFKVMASRRDKVGQSEIHVTDTDVFIVLEGNATIAVGGKIIAPKEVSPGEIRGTGIDGGTEYKLEKGVVLTVPRNTPHWIKQTQPGFRYFVVKSVRG